MSPHSRFESLPAELLSGILTQRSREELISLAQTCSSLRAACRKELIDYPLTMEVTSKNLKAWVAYFRKENTLLTQGARSLDITIAVAMKGLLGAVDDVDPMVFDLNARPIHPDASRILPLPSSLRKLSLKQGSLPGQNVDSDILLLILLRSLPERCPHLEELSIQANCWLQSDEIDKCIHRLTHLRKLHLQVWNMPDISNRLSLLPASLTDLYLYMVCIQTQEEVTKPVAWVRGIRKLSLMICTRQGIADVLMILSRGGATHLTELDLAEDPESGDPVEIMALREALTIGLQNFSLLQSPLHTLSLAGPSAWSDSLHLPLLHTAVASTLTQLSFQWMDSCIFPSHLPWPRLQSVELSDIPKIGYQGRLTEPIFPVLTAIIMETVGEIQAPEDLFPALETIKWRVLPTPEQVTSLVRRDIKRIDMSFDYRDDNYESLWEAMGEHTIDLIALHGYFPAWVNELANSGERVFPGFLNIREFTVSRD